jgi:predicted ATPase with chaperone activity
MVNKVSAARTALFRVRALHPDFHQPIIDELSKQGVLTDDGGVLHAAAKSKGLATHGRLLPRRTPNEAAAASDENAKIVNQLNARARRLGYTMPMDQILSPVEIDAAFSGKNVDERLAWKMTASLVGIL